MLKTRTVRKTDEYPIEKLLRRALRVVEKNAPGSAVDECPLRKIRPSLKKVNAKVRVERPLPKCLAKVCSRQQLIWGGRRGCGHGKPIPGSKRP